MLAIDVMDDAFELNTIADRPIHIDTHHIRTHLHTEALITFLLQHSKDAIAAVTAVANASPDPTDALVQEALRLAGARDPVVGQVALFFLNTTKKNLDVCRAFCTVFLE